MALLNKEKSKRLTLLFPEMAADRLDRLKEKTEAASYVEVIRSALFAYESLVDLVATGSDIKELTRRGDLRPVPLAIDVRRPTLVAITDNEATGKKKRA